MATNPLFSEESSQSWPQKGGAMSEEEYHKLERLDPDRKYEYIAGLAYMMSGGSVGHDRIAYNVRSSLDSQLRSGSCTAFGSDVQVLIGAKKNGRKHFVYPDTTVSCNAADSRTDNTLIESPKVVVEVLSPGTETKDRGVKFKAYQQCPTIQEIALVSQFAQYVQVWQRDIQNVDLWNYRQYGPGEIVEFASIDVHVAIGELYRGLNFALDEEDEE
jgi:Uma2 family endonuclease